MLKEGTAAPDFTGVDQGGRPFRLADLRGRWVILYFYPLDESLGCTMEACAFRDNLEVFTGLGAEVVGVSTQDSESHRQFADRHHLTFSLVADPDKRIAQAYDVLGFLGRARRVTYLIDPSGTIRDVYRSEVSPAGHVDHVKERLRALQSR